MVSPKLSLVETERIIEAATNSVAMERSSEPINDHIQYKAFAGKQILFTVLYADAFEAMWQSAKDLYAETQTKLKKKHK